MDSFRMSRRSAWPSVMASTMKNIPLNPVLTKSDLPEGWQRGGLRDPKVWREQDGTYYAVYRKPNP